MSQVCDMAEELRVEAVDMVVTAVEKHPGNFEVKIIPGDLWMVS